MGLIKSWEVQPITKSIGLIQQSQEFIMIQQQLEWVKIKSMKMKKSTSDLFYYIVVVFGITVIVLRSLVMILELFL